MPYKIIRSLKSDIKVEQAMYISEKKKKTTLL